MWIGGKEQLVPLLSTVYHHESTVWPEFIVKTEFACSDFKLHLMFQFYREELSSCFHVCSQVDWLSFSCCESDRLWRERNESWQVNKEVCHLWHFIQIICSCQSFSWWKTPQHFTIFYILISLWFLFCGFHLLYMSFTPWWKLRLWLCVNICQSSCHSAN